MKYIELTQGKRAKVDDTDYEELNKCKWRACSRHGHDYARTGKAYASYYMHRLIVGAAKGMFVDHINGDGLDNRRCNLRVCTREENGQNRTRLQTNNTSGYTGVLPRKGYPGLWQVQIKVNRKMLHIGYFKDKDLAIAARRRAELEYFGAFSPRTATP